MNEIKIYEKFIQWFRSSPMSFPDTENFVELIKARYTPEDAQLLTDIPFGGKTIEELAAIKNMSIEDLQPRLDALAKKGVVWKVFRYGAYKYRLCDFFLVFYRSVYWGGGRNSEHYKMAPMLNKTFGPYFEQQAHSKTRGLRTLPLEKTVTVEKTVKSDKTIKIGKIVKDERAFMPFENVLKVLDDQDYFCVGNCSCKAKHNLDPGHENCEHYPFEENCVHFGDFARYMVDNGHGRELSREACRDVLTQCAEAGLVHGVSNWNAPVDTI